MKVSGFGALVGWIQFVAMAQIQVLFSEQTPCCSVSVQPKAENGADILTSFGRAFYDLSETQVVHFVSHENRFVLVLTTPTLQ